MNREPLKKFLSLLGSGQIKDLGEWITAECPMARWTHKNGTDRHPSFGVRVNPNGASVYKCYSCKQKAEPIEALISIMSRLRGVYYKEASDLLLSYEIFDETDPPPQYNDKWKDTEKAKEIITLPLDIVSKYARLSDFSTPQEVKDYIHQRRTTLAICDYYNVRWSKEFNSLVFPSAMRKGITSIKARKIEQKKFFFLKGGLYLFGLDKIDCMKPVWLVEGEFDLLRLNALGEYNVVALGGSSIPSELPKYLHNHTLISALDSDQAGKEATRKLKSMYSGYYHIKTMDWESIGCKDAGEVASLEQFKEAKKFLC